MIWSLIYDETLYPHSNNGDYLIALIEELTGNRLTILATSNTAKPSWRLACRLVALIDVTGISSELNTAEAFRQNILIGRNQFVDIPSGLTPYDLQLEVPYWFADITIKIWQKSTDQAVGNNRVILTVDTNDQRVFPLPVAPINPALTELFINGIKATYPSEYLIDGSQLQWMDELELQPGDEVELIY
jgi:hypothetical protein